MQKLYRSKWRKNNPVGDTLQAKVCVTQRDNMVAQTSLNHIQILQPDFPNSRTPRLNDPIGLLGRFGSDNAGRGYNNSSSALAAQIFRRYRCKGVAATITVTPFWDTLVQPGVSEQTRRYMLCAWANAEAIPTGGNASGPTMFPFANIIPEQRWKKYRVIQQGWIYGGKPTKLRFYFNVNKVYGPDRIVKGDVNFTGQTDSFEAGGSGFAPLPVARPQAGPGLQIMIYTVDGNAFTNGVAFTIQIDWTFYIKYFQKYQNTIANTAAPLVPLV